MEQPIGEIDKCSNCIMACGEKSLYNESTKCCTYYPFIPNFMVGNILVNNLESAALIKSLITDKSYVLPIGLCVPESYQFKQKNNEGGFGVDESLLCPFYSKGKCNIWEQRNSECISFQCYSSYGELGLNLWKGLGDLIYDLELHIARNLMAEHGFADREVAESIRFINYKSFSQMREPKSSLTTKEWAAHWGDRLEAVAQYYISCYKMSLKLDLKSYISKLPDYIKLIELTKSMENTETSNFEH